MENDHDLYIIPSVETLTNKDFISSVHYIQTYIGHVLISVNPFQDLGIYTDDVLKSYPGKNLLEVSKHEKSCG